MDGSPLEGLADDRRRLQDALDRKMTELKAAVLVALSAGLPEADVARRAGVDRMTVREWAGKRSRRDRLW